MFSADNSIIIGASLGREETPHSLLAVSPSLAKRSAASCRILAENPSHSGTTYRARNFLQTRSEVEQLEWNRKYHD